MAPLKKNSFVNEKSCDNITGANKKTFLPLDKEDLFDVRFICVVPDSNGANIAVWFFLWWSTILLYHTYRLPIATHALLSTKPTVIARFLCIFTLLYTPFIPVWVSLKLFHD